MAAAVVTDSASALTADVCTRLGIHLVPLRVVVDDEDLDDTSIDGAWFYRRLAARAHVTTSQPAPAALLAAYRRAKDEGANLVWSVHVGTRLSSTLNAAALAAQTAPVPVRLVDSGTASMPLGLCVLAGLAALLEDPQADVDAIVAAEAASQENVFVSLTPSFLERSGRAGARFDDPLPVLSLHQGQPVEVVGSATDMNQAVRLMAGRAEGHGAGVTVAVGEGGASAWGDALFLAAAEAWQGTPIFRYRVPPSIGAHAGPTVGLVISKASLPAALRAALIAGGAGTGPSISRSDSTSLHCGRSRGSGRERLSQGFNP
jgi:DegV family protein with EDD domain